MLEYIGELADYISLHRYVGNPQDDTADYLAITNSIDSQIEEMDAVCRYVQARRRSRKRAYLCFDEWNVWYRACYKEHVDGAGKFAPHLLEEVYNLEDAFVVAGFLNSSVRHADVVKIANLAQIVNAIALLMTRGEELLVQSIYLSLPDVRLSSIECAWPLPHPLRAKPQAPDKPAERAPAAELLRALQ